MKNAHIVNFNFEQQWSNSKNAFPIQQQYSRECVYFFLEQNPYCVPLWTKNPHFTQEYFDYLSSAFGINYNHWPIVSGNLWELINWWGENNSQSKLLNSKLYALEIKKKLNLHIPGTQIITKNKDNFQQSKSSYPIIIQDPFGCSGFSNYFSFDDFCTHSSSNEGILMPFVQRLGDFSVSYYKNERPFITHLLNSKLGHFQSAKVAINPNTYTVDIHFDFDLLYHYANKILLETIDLRDPNRPWSMDFFFYIDSITGKMELTLSEINYRYSFGQLFRVLASYLNPGECKLFSQVSRKKIQKSEKLEQKNYLNPITCSSLLSWG